MSEDSTRGGSIAGDVRRGFLWSFANNLVLRLANLVLGMVLARLLVPAAFGVFAVGLTVQTILMTLADLGLSADLIRSHDPARRGPTVATLSLTSGVVLAIAMSLAAGPVASAMRAPRAAGVLVVLSWSLVVSSAGVVPYAKLTRDFQQGKLFACSALNFVTYTSVTIALVLLGLGPMALAVGSVAAQLMATALQFVLSRSRIRFGFDRNVARTALGFGLPLAGANFLSWALLNIDNVVIARLAGATSLGLYVLAFNISSWPMSGIGQAVRSVSLPAFSRTSLRNGERSLVTALGLTWSVALPVGVLLAALAHPLVILLYGHRWSPSAPALAALGIFGALRVAFDVIATYLMAKGAARPVLYVQVLWFIALIPPMVLATRWMGIAGAAWAHLAVGALVILPAYCLALSRVGTRAGSIMSALWLPTAAAIPTWWTAQTVANQMQQPLLGLLLGGAAGSIAYLAICYRWVRRLWPATQQGREAEPVDKSLLGRATT